MDRNRRVLDRLRTEWESVDERHAQAYRVAELIRKNGDYRWVGIYQVVGDEIVGLSWTGTMQPGYSRFPLTKGLCGAAIRDRSTVLVDDVAKDPRYLTTFDNTKSEIVVPIVAPSSGDALGVIDAESERLAAFSDSDRAFLEECATVLGRLWE